MVASLDSSRVLAVAHEHGRMDTGMIVRGLATQGEQELRDKDFRALQWTSHTGVLNLNRGNLWEGLRRDAGPSPRTIVTILSTRQVIQDQEDPTPNGQQSIRER